MTLKPPALRPEATRMFQEAAEAPAVVARMLAANHEAAQALGAELRAAPPKAVVTCARGSSDHAATYAKYLIETGTGVVTSSAALSVSSVYAAEPKLDGMLYLAISQSGKSPDLLAAVEAAKQGGARTVAEGIKAWNPVFDVTPGALIDVIVTERGVIHAPTEAAMRAAFGG